MFVPPATQATLILADGTTQPLTSLALRATEFTVGDNGPLAMPAELPPASQYTYAVQLSADEAVAAGPGAVVTFSPPVPFYVENFLSIPVGTPVPVGSYDAADARWEPEPNGITLRVLGTDGTGRALLDITGDGQADPPSALAALGIADFELVQLAGTYPPGVDLWRVVLNRTVPHDLNYPYILVGETPTDGDVKAGCSSAEGDPIRCQLQAQTAFQSVALVGSPFTLNYASDRTQGNAADRELAITLTGPTPPANLVRVELEVRVAGQRFRGSFPASPNLTHTFSWDGRDLYGRQVQATQPATVLIGYVYPVFYAAPAGTTQSFGLPCTPSATTTLCPLAADVRTGARTEQTLVQVLETSIGTLDATALGLGGFTVDVQHAYDPLGGVLYQGDGTRRITASLPAEIMGFAGTGNSGFISSAIVDGIPATQSIVSNPSGLVVAPDGSVYLADQFRIRVRKVDPSGIITTVAGTGTFGFSGDGGPATQARLSNPAALALGPDGSLYVVDQGNRRIRRISPAGIITTIAGDGTCGFAGDGGPATSARLCQPEGLAVGADGSVYVADGGNSRIRRIGPDGRITTIAGTGQVCFTLNPGFFDSFCGEGIPATAAKLTVPRGLALGPDGSLYFTQDGSGNWISPRLRRIGPDGIVRTVAGIDVQFGTPPDAMGDGGPARQARLLFPGAVAVGADGSVYVVDQGLFNPAGGGVTQHFPRIRRVRSDGIITTVVGDGTFGSGGDGGPALRAQLASVEGVAVGPDGSLYLAADAKVRRVRAVLPGLAVGTTVIAAADGSELYVFSPAGRMHLTLDALTRDTVYQFSYNTNRQLVAITDRDGRVTTIERDASGVATAVVTPTGQRTALAIGVGMVECRWT